VIRTGERPVQALCNRGVQYIEVRCMDIDPFEPVGISLETGRFLDAFLMFCALEESPAIDPAEGQVHAANFARTVKEGRKPGLTLTREGKEVPLTEWALQLVERIRPVAQLLDSQHDEAVHESTLAVQKARIEDPSKTPSARVLEEVRAIGSFKQFGLQQSELHAKYFRENGLMPAEEALFEEQAAASLAEQAVIEQQDTGSFDDFVAKYNSSTLCGN
jgi:glutamate--cysteine ligase